MSEPRDLADESESQRLTRNLNELLQELRVTQTGVQILTGFLLTLPFSDETVPSDAELRIAQAQLVGWLEGLFHDIQTALFAQQMAARVQLEQMRGRPALPPGVVDPSSGPQAPGAHGTGQYL